MASGIEISNGTSLDASDTRESFLAPLLGISE